MTEITQELIRHPRPARLSDPGRDFTPEECAAILDSPLAAYCRKEDLVARLWE